MNKKIFTDNQRPREKGLNIAEKLSAFFWAMFIMFFMYVLGYMMNKYLLGGK